MKKVVFLVCVIAAVLFPILMSAQNETVAQNAPITASRMNFINFANTMLGVEFRLGGEKPEQGFDSFGLVKYAAKKSLGKKLPRDGEKLYASMDKTFKKSEGTKNLIPGDLVFFKSNPNGKITDVGIYLGIYQVEGKFLGKEVFLYASARPVKIGKRKRTRPCVAIGDMADYVWKNQYAGAGRFLPEIDATIQEMTAEETSDFLKDENVGAGDLENIAKDVDNTQLEAGIGAQFEEAEQKSAEIFADLEREAIKQAGGENKFKSATQEQKSVWIEKAKSVIQSMDKYANSFFSESHHTENVAASSTKITETSVGTISSIDASDARREFIEYSMRLRGIPYVWGGTTPKGFDCSGFVQYSALHGVNLTLPRTAAAMSSYASSVSRANIEPGDLVFFKSRGKVSHVGIYLGRYRGSGRLAGREVFINAASAGPSTGVTLSALDEPTWKRTFCGAGRILPSAIDSSSQLDYAVASLLK